MGKLSDHTWEIIEENQSILDMGQDMTTHQMFWLMDQGVSKHRIRMALDMPRRSFEVMLKMYELGRARTKENMVKCEVCGADLYRFVKTGKPRYVCQQKDCMDGLARIKREEAIQADRMRRMRNEALRQSQAQKVSG